MRRRLEAAAVDIPDLDPTVSMATTIARQEAAGPPVVLAPWFVSVAESWVVDRSFQQEVVAATAGLFGSFRREFAIETAVITVVIRVDFI